MMVEFEDEKKAIELEHRKKERYFPIAYDVETNTPNLHLMDFAITLQKYPSQIHPTYKKAGKRYTISTIEQITYFINKLANQEYVDPETGENMRGVHYLQATWENNMKPLIAALRNGNGEPDAAWEETSLRVYVRSWRAFYRFLTLTNVHHSMYMPDTIAHERKSNIDDNFVSHTQYDHIYEGEIETAIDTNNIKYREDYCDSVWSMEDIWSIYAVLYEEDSVFSAMLFAEITTCLRVSALLNDFTLVPTPMNPLFKTYPQIKNKDNIAKQSISFINKGGDKREVFLSKSVHAILHNDYMAPPIDAKTGIIPMSYLDRLKEYKKKCKRCKKWGANKDPNAKPTWITKAGTPVTYDSYNDALKRAQNILCIPIRSHMARHTGATQLLWRYLKANNKTPCYTNHLMVNDAHKVIQKVLGHKSVETTRRYVLTIERMIAEKQMDDMLNYTFSKSRAHFEELAKTQPELANTIERVVKRIDAFMHGGER